MINIEIKHYAYRRRAWVSRTPFFTIKSQQVKQLFKDQILWALTEKKFMGK
jgi:hypothetical protein